MTSQPIRDPVADHLITPQNSAFLLIDWQPDQISTVRSMDTRPAAQKRWFSTREDR